MNKRKSKLDVRLFYALSAAVLALAFFAAGMGSYHHSSGENTAPAVSAR